MSVPIRRIALLLLLATPGAAPVVAQPTAALVEEPGLAIGAAAEAAVPAKVPSPRTALLLSLGGTLVPVAAGEILGGASKEAAPVAASILMTGLVVGPSVGYFYGRCPGRGWLGLGLRGGASAAAFTTIVIMASQDETRNVGGLVAALGLTAVTLVVVTASDVLDVCTVHGVVRRRNQPLSPRALRWTPELRLVGGSPGVALATRF